MLNNKWTNIFKFQISNYNFIKRKMIINFLKPFFPIFSIHPRASGHFNVKFFIRLKLVDSPPRERAFYHFFRVFTLVWRFFKSLSCWKVLIIFFRTLYLIFPFERFYSISYTKFYFFFRKIWLLLLFFAIYHVNFLINIFKY